MNESQAKTPAASYLKIEQQLKYVYGYMGGLGGHKFLLIHNTVKMASCLFDFPLKSEELLVLAGKYLI